MSSRLFSYWSQIVEFFKPKDKTKIFEQLKSENEKLQKKYQSITKPPLLSDFILELKEAKERIKVYVYDENISLKQNIKLIESQNFFLSEYILKYESIIQNFKQFEFRTYDSENTYKTFRENLYKSQGNSDAAMLSDKK